MKPALLLILFSAASAWAQVNLGELRLKIVDPAGVAVRASIELEFRFQGI